MPKPVITMADATRMMKENPDMLLKPQEWMDKNGISTTLLNLIIEAMTAAIVLRSELKGEDISEALEATLCSTFQLGWEMHREFGGT